MADLSVAPHNPFRMMNTNYTCPQRHTGEYKRYMNSIERATCAKNDNLKNNAHRDTSLYVFVPLNDAEKVYRELESPS